MKNLVLAIIAAAMIAGSSHAFAADLPVATRAPEIVPTWAGWYFGINAGGVSAGVNPSTTVSSNNYFPTGSGISNIQDASSTSVRNSPVLEGAQVGYLGQWGNIVAGVEAGIDWMGIDTSKSERTAYNPQFGTACAPNCFFNLNRSIKSDWMFTLLGRLGMAYGPVLPYITGGMAVSNLRYQFAFADANFAAPGFARVPLTSISSTQIGFAIGAGVDWQVAPNWSVRGEYLHVEFDPLSGTTPPLAPPATNTTTFAVSSGRFKENIGRVAVSYRFGQTAQTAYAADLPVKAVPPPTPVASWTGFYVGGDAGVAWSRSGAWTFNDPNATLFSDPAFGAQTSQAAALAGFHAGYNWQFAPTWVVGIEGDYAWSNLSDDRANSPLRLGATVIPNTFLAMKTETRSLASVRARLGFVGWANTMFYATGGVGRKSVHFSGFENNRPPTFATNFLSVASTSKASTGWVAGAGAEAMVAPHVSVRAEYLYYGFNSSATTVANLQPNPGAFPLAFVYNWASQNIQVVRTGVSYKF